MAVPRIERVSLAFFMFLTVVGWPRGVDRFLVARLRGSLRLADSVPVWGLLEAEQSLVGKMWADLTPALGGIEIAVQRPRESRCRTALGFQR